MEAENSMHPDNVGDDKVWEEDVEGDVAKFLIVMIQVSTQAGMDLFEALHRL